MLLLPLQKQLVLRVLKPSTIGTFAFVLVTIGCYWFWATGGRFTDWIHQTSFYDEQAEGFRSGHLYTNLAPNPQLLKLAQPLNPINRRFWHWDYSFYQGHLYMYWGLAPAAALALVKSLFRIHAPVGDEFISFFFVTMRLIVSVALVRRLARHVRSSPPEWAVFAAMAVVAFGNPTPFTLARGAVYEAAINGGTFFITAGFWAAHRFLWAQNRQHFWLVLASLSFALAGACRANQWLGGAAALGVLTLAALFNANRGAVSTMGLKRIVYILLASGLPYASACGTHLLINFLRFGSWSEFGVTYQMGFAFEMGPRYILPNLWQYFLHPLHASCQFPFLEAKWHRPPSSDFPKWLSIPPRYYYPEPVAGLLYVYPLCWVLGLGAVGFMASKAARLAAFFAARPETTDSGSVDGGAVDGGAVDGRAVDGRAEGNERDKRQVWFLAMVLTSMMSAATPLLLIFASSMRYEADVMPGVHIVVILAAWRTFKLFGSASWRYASSGLYALLCVGTVLAGSAYGFNGYYQLFKAHNPQLMSKMVDLFSVCTTSPKK